MKSNLIYVLLLTVVMSSYGQDYAIDFHDGDWASALQAAGDRDKIIFVDAYTTWCGPCKSMDKKVFSQEPVGQFFNDHFINVKLDMEKGEGLIFAENYDVDAYPTYIFVDAEGDILHKALGYHEPDDFIAIGEAALDRENRLGTLHSQYESRNRSPEFLYRYTQALTDAYDDRAEEVGKEYLATQNDWLTEENAKVLSEVFPPKYGDELFSYVIKHRTELNDLGAKNQIHHKLMTTAMRKIHEESLERDDQKALFSELFSGEGERYFQEYEMRQYSRMKDDEMKEKYFTTTIDYYERYPSDNWRVLNSIAWRFYENTDDEAYLSQALKWALTSVEVEQNYYNTDTAAALCYKLGKKAEALEWAKEAVKVAKENDIDPTPTEELIEKIEAL